jgi:hypothetical protein
LWFDLQVHKTADIIENIIKNLLLEKPLVTVNGYGSIVPGLTVNS